MKPKVGQSFWSAFVYEGKVDIEEWVVTSVRRKCVWKQIRNEGSKYQNTVYLTRKTRHTWVKKSRKHFDYGWAKNISRRDRGQVIYGDDWKQDSSRGFIFSTRLKALKACERWENSKLREKREDFPLEEGGVYTVAEQRADIRRDLAAVRRAITRERNKRK